MVSGLRFRRAVVDARLMGAGLLNPRSGYGSKIVLLIGLAYPFGPIDLIPNRLPVIGYLDQVAFVVGGIALAYLLLPPCYRAAPARPPRALGPSLGALATQLARRMRATLLDSFAGLFAVPMLRLATGAWPAPSDVKAFRSAFRHFTPLPPLLRALAVVPAGREQLTRAMLASWLMADDEYRGRFHRQVASDDARPGSPLRVWSGPPVTFLHLEKTGGMSTVAALAAEFHPMQIDADPVRAFPPHVLSPLPGFVVPRVQRCRLVWGHYDLPSIHRLGPGRFTFTVLREPRARVRSLYRYWRGQAKLDLGWNGMNQPVLAAQRLDFAAFLASDDPMVANYIDNFYVRRLTGYYSMPGELDALAQEPDRCLREALAALASLDFVGLTGDVDGTMAVLGARLGFTPSARAPRVNVTQAPPAQAAEQLDVESALDWLTRFDCIVYDAAVARFVAEQNQPKAASSQTKVLEPHAA